MAELFAAVTAIDASILLGVQNFTIVADSTTAIFTMLKVSTPIRCVMQSSLIQHMALSISISSPLFHVRHITSRENPADSISRTPTPIPVRLPLSHSAMLKAASLHLAWLPSQL